MAEAYGQGAVPLLQSFDQRLEEARAASAVEVLPPSGQEHMIRSLGRYASTLERIQGDQRFRLSHTRELLEESDWMGNVTRYTRDVQSNITSVTDPLGAVTTYTYDDRGNRVTSTDANGNTTRYS